MFDRWQHDGDSSKRWSRPLFVALYLVVCFYSLEHDWRFAGQGALTADREENLELAIEVTERHSVIRDGSLAVLALGGIGMMLYGPGRRKSLEPWMSTLSCIFVLWLIVGFVLSTDREGVFRKFVGFSGVIMAAAGCARWLPPQEMVRTAWLAFGSFVGLGLLADLVSGGVFVNPQYRFSGTLHPNLQGIYCAVVCMASVCLARIERNALLFKVGGTAAFVCLVLTGSRGSLFALLVAFLAMWIASRNRVERLQAWAALTCVVAVLAMGYACLGVGLSRELKEALLLGRTEGVNSFSGRTPLWEELWKTYAPQRFWTGYGLGGFWIGERIEELYESQEWAMGNAHNLYLDLLLQTGAVGLAIALTTLASLFMATESQLARTQDVGYQFFMGVFAFAVGNGTMESIFVHPTKFPTFLFLACALSVVCFVPGADARRPAAAALAEPRRRRPYAASGAWFGEGGERGSRA